jgi:hypothetical protein
MGKQQLEHSLPALIQVVAFSTSLGITAAFDQAAQ